MVNITLFDSRASIDENDFPVVMVSIVDAQREILLDPMGTNVWVSAALLGFRTPLTLVD